MDLPDGREGGGGRQRISSAFHRHDRHGRISIVERLRAQTPSSKFQTPSSKEAPNSKPKMTKEIRSPKLELRRDDALDIRASTFLRISSFVILVRPPPIRRR